MFYNYLASRKQTQVPTAGFTLVELLVSISIMVLVAGVIIARQSAFNGAVLLRSQAYDVALDIREVQLSAVSASGRSGQFRSVLGIAFNTNSSQNGFYKIFADADSDGFFDAAEAFGQQGILDKRFEIRAIRAVGSSVPISEVSIVFVRPNFDARFFRGPGTEINVSSIEIDIARKGVVGTGVETVRTVEVTSTGQITVQ